MIKSIFYNKSTMLVSELFQMAVRVTILFLTILPCCLWMYAYKAIDATKSTGRKKEKLQRKIPSTFLQSKGNHCFYIDTFSSKSLALVIYFVFVFTVVFVLQIQLFSPLFYLNYKSHYPCSFGLRVLSTKKQEEA